MVHIATAFMHVFLHCNVFHVRSQQMYIPMQGSLITVTHLVSKCLWCCLRVMLTNQLLFALPKAEFHDAVCLRFGLQPVNLLQICVCGKSFPVEHTFSYPWWISIYSPQQSSWLHCKFRCVVMLELSLFFL